MGTGKVADHDLNEVLSRVTVPGDVAEIGVYRGHLFTRLAAWAGANGRHAHAFDSFVGMSDPGPKDGDGYPRGSMSAGGVERFTEILDRAGVDPSCYTLHPGFIPACFESCSAESFALAYVDVDHHDPTEAALAWVWPRIAPGGILGLDDYFPGRAIFASPAIGRFLNSVATDAEPFRFNNNQLWLLKRQGQARIPNMPGPRFHEWEITHEAAALLPLIPEDRDVVGAEVGTLIAKSSCILLHRRPRLRLYLVDDWQSRPYARGMAEGHLNEAHASDRAAILHGDSTEMAERVAGASLDFVFIDASKSPGKYRADCLAWLPKIRPGGFLAGHDYDWKGIPEVVAEVIEVAGREASDLRVDGKHNAWMVEL